MSARKRRAWLPWEREFVRANYAVAPNVRGNAGQTAGTKGDMSTEDTGRLASPLTEELGRQVDARVIDCWRVNYGLDKTPHELHSFWQGCTPPGAVLALKAAVSEIERLQSLANDTHDELEAYREECARLRLVLKDERARPCNTERECIWQPFCGHEGKCMRPANATGA